VALSRYTDGGFNCASPIAVNDEGAEADHGFAPLWPAARERSGVARLSGAPQQPMDHAAMQHGEGSTGLHAAVFDMDLQRSDQGVVDALTCDCCQSDIAMSSQGPLLAYRDRTGKEVRDIVVVRNDGKRWGKPVPVHADGWVMPGCPVHGPAIAAVGDQAVVAWYTEAGNDPRVLVARSTDAGSRFGEPIVLDHGEAVQGRVALALDARQAWIAWFTEDASGQSLWLSRRSPDLSREYQRTQVAKLQGRGRATGYPQLALRSGTAYLAWTDVVAGMPQLRGVVIGP
jgi:hypothetical protein